MLLLIVALTVTVIVGMSLTAMAAEGKKAAKSTTMEGYIIDTKCAEANKAKLGEFVKTHTKECATAPDCKKTGYNIYSDGKLYKFDKASNKKISEFLDKADSTLQVKVEVEHKKGDVLKLVTIENAK